MAITDVFVQPDIRRHRITVTVNAPEVCEAAAEIEGVSGPVHAPVNTPFSIDFPDYGLWQPGEGHFHTLAIELVSGETVLDRRTVAFAMREVTVKDQRFVVNNRPQFLKAVRLPDDSADIDLGIFPEMLSYGFNALFVSAAHLFTSLLDAADAHGLPLFVKLDTVDVTEVVKQHRNRACVAAWILRTDAATPAVREIDPTRLILASRDDAATYLRPYRTDPQPMEHVLVGIDSPPTRAAENLLRNVGQQTMLSLVEAAWIPGRPGGLEPFGLAHAAAARQRRLAELFVSELRANARVAGYLLPFEALDRPEFSKMETRNQPLLPVIQMHRTNLTPRQEAPVTVTLVNEERIEGRADLSLQVVGPTNQVLWKKKRNVKIPRHGRELWSGTVAASGSTGRHQFVVQVRPATGGMAEASHPFDVFKPLDKTDQHVDVVGDGGPTVEALEKLGYHLTPAAPVVLVPRLANTVRAYPDNPLANALGRAHSGAVAIVFSPPPDWNEFADLVSPALAIEVHVMQPTREAAFRTARLHPVFDNLPTRSVMGREYAGTIGPSIGMGDTEEEISGGKIERADGSVVDAADIVVRRYGSGRVVFVFLDPLDALGQDPLADRLLENLVRHFARRSLPSEGAFPAHQRAVEWLRDERVRGIRRWHVIGPFANPAGAGHAEAYPPEIGLDLEATYPGWFAAVFWKPYFAFAREGVVLPLDSACRAHHRAVSQGDSGTYYAYSEVSSDQRGRAKLQIESRDAVACWFNRAEVLRSAHADSLPAPVTLEATVPLRQGRNSILLKCSKTAGEARARVTLTPLDEPVTLRWWN